MYARTTGYLDKRLVDIGDHVKQGQLLAKISAPDVDAQLAQAQADLAQAKANLPLTEANAELAKITLKRYNDAGPGTGVTLLQIDQQEATVKTTAGPLVVFSIPSATSTTGVSPFTLSLVSASAT